MNNYVWFIMDLFNDAAVPSKKRFWVNGNDYTKVEI